LFLPSEQITVMARPSTVRSAPTGEVVMKKDGVNAGRRHPCCQFALAVSANPFGSSSKIYTIRPYDERDMAHTSKKLTDLDRLLLPMTAHCLGATAIAKTLGIGRASVYRVL